MVFLRSQSQHDSWQHFCGLHEETLAKCGLPTAIIRAEHQLRDLLREGSVQAAKVQVSLSSISETEWIALEKFAAVFFNECESYAPKERFPAFFKEAERRKANDPSTYQHDQL
jgi:hypothetical protein